MRTYGKALSTYRRINKIKSSVNAISEAQNRIGEQRAIAMSEANEIANNNQVVNALVQGGIQAGSAAIQSFGKFKNISPEQVAGIAAGASLVSGMGINAASQRNARDTFAGLGQQGAMAFTNSMSNPINSATTTYAMNQMFADARNSREMRNMTEGGEGGFSQNELLDIANRMGITWRDEPVDAPIYSPDRIVEIGGRDYSTYSSSNNARRMAQMIASMGKNDFNKKLEIGGYR